jgi:hypothetical protein
MIMPDQLTRDPSSNPQALLRGWEVCDCNGATEARSRCCYE